MNLQQLLPTRASPFAGAVPARLPAMAFDEVVLRPLKTAADIASVLHLRDEIDLSVHAASGPQFGALEKKETSAGSWSHSTSMRNA